MNQDRKTVRWFQKFAFLTLACMCFLLVQSRSAFGQVDEGSITGTVQDTSGAVVAGAHVTLLNKEQGLSLETVTAGSGEYSFNPVRIGHYTLTVTAQGFSKTAQENLELNVSQNLQVNVQLKPGAATETVTVTDAPPALQTEDASIGQVVTEQTVNSLPLNGRNFTFLAQLGAGVNTPQADTRGNAASGAFSANGLRPAQNNYLLDGIDNNSNAVDFLNGTNFIVLPPVDAVSEFKVQTGEFSAELGRSAGAVLNATIKSGTNSFHGSAWEFLRNDVFDAADWFENNQATPTKAKLRLNQFGATAGGPILKNKIFFFGDYEGTRRVEGNTSGTASVPSLAERNPNAPFQNMSDLIGGTARADALGRMIIPGTILDPATTRAVAAGAVDSVSGLTNTSNGVVYVRDPFGCSPANKAPTLGNCALNQIPADRIDPNAVKLLDLYPNPNTNGTSASSNFISSPKLFEHRNNFDTRVDFNPTASDQVFFRFSYVDDPQYIPGVFGGVADGGSFQQGIQTAKSDQAAAAYTHLFSPTTVNVGRVGFNHLHTTRFGPDGSVMGIPAQYGILGIPQVAENGGLPAFGIGNTSTLGSNNFLPSDEISQTLQVTDDFTKIYGKHSFKAGIEYQHVKFSTLQPAWSRGQFDFDGRYTDIPQNNTNATGRAQFLLQPTAASYPDAGGIGYSGGSDQVYASNINKTYDEKNYFATYLQDDWKVNPKLTINLGIRWDYFGPIQESNGAQANFVPSGAPDNKPEYIIPKGGKSDKDVANLSAFLALLQTDGITPLITDKYGKGLVQTQKTNFAPRVGFAFQATPKLVTRGGFGMFYNSFENQGYGPNIGENYPFVFNFDFVPKGGDASVFPVSAQTPFATDRCQQGGTPGPGGTATFESGFSCIALSPALVNPSGLGLQGLQFAYQTPLTLSANATLQYAVTRTLSAQASYVVTHGLHLQTGIGTNHVKQLLPNTLPTGQTTANYVDFPDFSQGSSYHTTVGDSTYNGLQTKLEEQFSGGLSFVLSYTWSKTLGDAGDLLNGGSTGGYRAPEVPGLGPSFDRGPADFDIRQVVHFSGGYQLPFGKDKKFLNHSGKIVDAVLGGWSAQWIATLQGGQPINIGCPTGTTSGTGCNVVKVAGQSQKLGIRKDGNGLPNWFGNPLAFQQPCKLDQSLAPIPESPAGCISLTGNAALGGKPGATVGPGFHRLDFSAFKRFALSERFSLEFRAEMFNILNHPNFNAPGFGGNGVNSIGNSTNFNNVSSTGVTNFGEIGSTRDAPNDPRQIQFAMKLYY